MDSSRIAENEKKYVIHSWMAQKDFKPFIVTGGKGAVIWDETGKKYLDFSSQLFNVNIGHQHPKVVAAIKEQADKLCYVGPGTANDTRGELCRMLAEIAPGDLVKTFLSSGGGTANENAIKIARLYTGKSKIISRWRSFHGATYGAISITGDPRRLANEPGIPGIVRIWEPFCYRCFFDKTYPECNVYCADRIRDVIEVEGPKTIAGIIVEPITGSNCRIIPPDGYMQRLRQICDEYKILLIADEVMTGFGRTGKWFACEHWNVVPDIMTLAKGINNAALPLGATMVRKPIADFMEDHMFYGGLTQFGNPISCAAAIASIQIYQEEGLIENSRVLGNKLLVELEKMKQKHPSIGDVRGLGIFAAIEFVKDKKTREPLVPWTVEHYEKKDPAISGVLNQMKAEGVIGYSRWNVIFIAPPLCITEEQLMEGLRVIDKAVNIVDEAISKK
ncbi:MAG: aminotransferase class III-fold pyridoxal phosphate-dependent enzyme [Desulfobacterales bacterium]|nr:aminotransferase class III-fold pyridoxal phosphate-dependent enzyme [Desulfobacterales bacterium]